MTTRLQPKRRQWLLAMMILLVLASASARLMALEVDPEVLDPVCFGRQAPEQPASQRCQVQQKRVADAAKAAEARGETTESAVGFGVFEFVLEGTRIACLRAGTEIKCLLADTVAPSRP